MFTSRPRLLAFWRGFPFRSGLCGVTVLITDPLRHFIREVHPRNSLGSLQYKLIVNREIIPVVKCQLCLCWDILASKEADSIIPIHSNCSGVGVWSGRMIDVPQEISLAVCVQSKISCQHKQRGMILNIVKLPSSFGLFLGHHLPNVLPDKATLRYVSFREGTQACFGNVGSTNRHLSTPSHGHIIVPAILFICWSQWWIRAGVATAKIWIALS
mmetsp:Transcript_33632/g.69957  ORF Transcript_33632/g.69957 Transcript_33632/m.69957 type:complete len:214 (-) Transcript_33632:813-1454(-)